MVGLLGSLVGAAFLGAIVLVGFWLTWLGLREETHTPKALRVDETEPPD